jgi:hypothetical protein
MRAEPGPPEPSPVRHLARSPAVLIGAITLVGLVIRVWYVLAHQDGPVTTDGLYAYQGRAQ